MSLELDWSLLDDELAAGILARLNKSLGSATRPEFLGPISLTSLEFGEDAPDVRLTQVGDVWRQFLDSSNAVPDGVAARNAAAVGHGGAGPLNDDDGDYDDVEDVLVPGEVDYRHLPERPGDHLARFAERSLPFTGQTTGRSGPRLQTFRQYTPSDLQQIHSGGGPGSAVTTTVGTPLFNGPGSGSRSASGLGTPAWSAGLGTRSSFVNGAGAANPSASGAGGAGGYFSPWPTHLSHSLLVPPPLARPQGAPRRTSSFAPAYSASRDGRSPSAEYDETGGASPSSSSSAVPSLQLHFSTVWSTNTVRLGINTSLLINHPTPAFMELPLSVSVIGLGVQAGCVVAFEEGEGKGRKVHISLVEDDANDEDGEGEEEHDEGVQEACMPTNQSDTQNAPSASVSGDPALSAGHISSSTLPAKVPRPQRPNATPASAMHPPNRPLTVGERLIPHITLETSVGNADKHVLRNVGKVEKFLVELLRKAVEDELVWPNFYTVALAGGGGGD